jgi:hypothetical protein
MREGATESEAYLEGWAPGPESERPGGAQAVAQAVADELEAGFQDLVVRRFWARRAWAGGPGRSPRRGLRRYNPRGQ